ncbi:MAG TPA: hypothetical protein VLA74_09080 [Nitrososphaeraceae archaeon]|nr:hypothetical protein [Nitrososphaeraceae archaeon]
MPNKDDSNKRNSILSTSTTIESLAVRKQQQSQQQHVHLQEQDDSHRGKNPHSKISEEILLKHNKQNIIDFLLDNIDSIRIEDLKIYEPIYKCYREKGNSQICNSLSNIICKNCKNTKDIWFCTNHWKKHAI